MLMLMLKSMFDTSKFHISVSFLVMVNRSKFNAWISTPQL